MLFFAIFAGPRFVEIEKFCYHSMFNLASIYRATEFRDNREVLFCGFNEYSLSFELFN